MVCLLVAEKDSFRALAAESKYISIVSSKFIHGYKLYVDISLVLNDDTVFKTFMLPAFGESTSISVVEFKFRKRDNGLVQFDSQIENIFNELDNLSLEPLQTEDGTIMLGKKVDRTTHIPIPNGDYDANLPLLHLNLNLRSLKCDDKKASLFSPPSQSTISIFLQRFNINLLSPPPIKVIVSTLIQLIHVSLNYLDFGFHPNPDLICDQTLSSLKDFIQSFKLDSEQAEYVFPKLCNCFSSYSCLLSSLGYPSPQNPFTQLSHLKNQLKNFQQKNAIPTSQKFDSLTRNRIDMLVKNSHAVNRQCVNHDINFYIQACLPEEPTSISESELLMDGTVRKKTTPKTLIKGLVKGVKKGYGNIHKSKHGIKEEGSPRLTSPNSPAPSLDSQQELENEKAIDEGEEEIQDETAGDQLKTIREGETLSDFKEVEEEEQEEMDISNEFISTELHENLMQLGKLHEKFSTQFSTLESLTTLSNLNIRNLRKKVKERRRYMESMNGKISKQQTFTDIVDDVSKSEYQLRILKEKLLDVEDGKGAFEKRLNRLKLN